MHEFRRAGVCGLVWLAVGVSCAYAAGGEEKSSQAETVVIPLDQIWAYGMPETRKLYTRRGRLQSEFASNEIPAVEEIYISLQKMEYDKQLPPAFVVLGSGLKALNHADDILACRKKRRTNFTTNEETSVFFFARGRHEHVYIRKVERLFGRVRIQYQFVPYLIGPQTTVHFAIIPMGKLALGKMKVEIIRLPIDKQPKGSIYEPPSQVMESRIVSRSFQIIVNKSVPKSSKDRE